MLLEILSVAVKFNFNFVIKSPLYVEFLTHRHLKFHTQTVARLSELNMDNSCFC